MENLMLEIYDLVSIQGEVGTWTIMGIGTEEPSIGFSSAKMVH